MGSQGSFFCSCWDFIKVEIAVAVQFFFCSSYIQPRLNSNFMVLILKLEDDVLIQNYRPIMLGKFFFLRLLHR